MTAASLRLFLFARHAGSAPGGRRVHRDLAFQVKQSIRLDLGYGAQVHR